MDSFADQRRFSLVRVLVYAAIMIALAALAVPSLMRSRMTVNERLVGETLRRLVQCEADWRARDLDRNGVADYWTRDVAAFASVHDDAGDAVRLIPVPLARADKFPAAEYPERLGITRPHYGHYFIAMTTDQDGAPYIDGRLPPPRAGNLPPGPGTNRARFGFTAWQEVYSQDGLLHLMVGEDGVVWQKDTGNCTPLSSRATAAPPGSDTTWAQWGGD